MGSLLPLSQTGLKEALYPSIVNTYIEQHNRQEQFYLRSYGRHLLGGLCSNDSLAVLDEAHEQPDRT